MASVKGRAQEYRDPHHPPRGRLGLWPWQTVCTVPWGRVRAPRPSSRLSAEVVSPVLLQAGAALGCELRPSGRQFSKWLQMWREIISRPAADERKRSSSSQASTQGCTSTSQGWGSERRDGKKTLVKKTHRKTAVLSRGGLCNHRRFGGRFC